MFHRFQSSRNARKLSLFLAIISVASFAFSNSQALASPSFKSAASDQYSGKLVYWFWAESDVPGSTVWMQSAIKRYEALHKNISIELVPQGSDTLQGAFETTAQSKSGPDIAMQWATLPVLTPVWRGQVASLKGLVSPSEMANWLNTSENVSGGQVWAMPMYLLGEPFVWNKTLFKKAGLDPEKGPKTWSEFLAACTKLKAAGITPIQMGLKDGAFGAWFQATVGTQNLNSVSELQDVYTGKAKFTDPKYSGYLTQLEMLSKKGYFNKDIASIDINQAWQNFAQGKGAMTWTTDGNVASWVKAGLEKQIGVQMTPKLGTGKLASYYTATQSISAFITSWSKNKKAAAAFLVWLHQPENLDSWYKDTGAFPADKRFATASIQSPLMKQLFALNSLPGQVWAENYAPPQVDSNGLRPFAQAVITGTSTPAKAAADIQKSINQWQTQQPADFKSYKLWASGK